MSETGARITSLDPRGDPCGAGRFGGELIMDTATFKDRLLARRNQLGLSQEAAAEQLGVSFQTFNSWERGRHAPRIQAVLRAVEQWLAGGETTVTK